MSSKFLKRIIFTLTSLLYRSPAHRPPSVSHDRPPEGPLSPPVDQSSHIVLAHLGLPGDTPSQLLADTQWWGHTPAPSPSGRCLWVCWPPGSGSAPEVWRCSCERAGSDRPLWPGSCRLVLSPDHLNTDSLLLTSAHLVRVVDTLLPGDNLTLLLGHVPAVHPGHLLTPPHLHHGVVPRSWLLNLWLLLANLVCNGNCKESWTGGRERPVIVSHSGT